jgi:hypothetical protein
MIKFFRQIRQKLLSDKQFSKYILYAIGEIFLVVIGILIALQINTWNEDRKNLEKENYYLNSIKTSISLSQSELDRVITDAQHISSAADTLFLLLAYKNYDRLNGVFIDSLLFSAGDYSLISLNDGAIQEILNTGSLNLIRDDRIRIDLASWNERMHQIRKFEGETENLSRNYLEYLKPFFDFRRYVTDSLGDGIIPEKKQQLLSDPLLSNYLMTITGLHRSMYIRYSQEKAMLDSLYIYIDKYLGK